MGDDGTVTETYHVLLTGKRLASVDDDILLLRLQAKFRLSEAQAMALLSKAQIVKRGADEIAARRLIDSFADIGLEARRLPSTRPPSPAAQLKQLATQKLAPPAAGLGYRVNLLLVTLLCLLIPFAYAAVTASVAYGWLWYLGNIHEHLPTQVGFLVMLIYLVPGATGAVLIPFLMRPLLARRAAPESAVRLDPKSEPELIAGIDALCRAIGVASPREIYWNLDVNASVQLARGPFSRQQTLTIGLPLAAGLTARQFIGVLAHEFGHFAQRAGIRCHWVINGVNGWLHHCAFEDEGFDRWLISVGDRWNIALVQLSIAGAMLGVVVTRGLMAMLFHLSFRVSQGLSRHLEFDADRYEGLIAGSDCFEQTALRLRILELALGDVHRINAIAWREGKLLRSIPQAVARQSGTYGQAQIDAARAQIQEATTQFWDSHPADQERIARVVHQHWPGMYRDEHPATMLFSNVQQHFEDATAHYYHQLGLRWLPDQLQDLDTIFGVSDRDQAQRDSVDRYFNGLFMAWPTLTWLIAPAPSDDTPDWQACIDQLRRSSPEFTRDWQAVRTLESRRGPLAVALALEGAPASLGLPEVTPRTVREVRDEYRSICQRSTAAHRRLQPALTLAAIRVQHAVNAMSVADKKRATMLLALLREMRKLEFDAATLFELDAYRETFDQIANAIDDDESEAEEKRGSLRRRLEAECRARFGEHFERLLSTADSIPQTLTPGGSVGQHLRRRGHLRGWDRRELSRLIEAGPMVANALIELYLMCIGELVALCEATEAAHAIRPIRLFAAAAPP